MIHAGTLRRAALGLVGLSLAALSSPAAAQSVALDHYRAAPTGADGFVVSRPVALGHLRPAASLHLDYALSPLVLKDEGQVVSQLVEHQLAGQLGLALGLFDRFVAYVRVPVLLAMEGSPTPGFPMADGAGLGDLALGARVLLHGDADEPFALALELEATMPTAAAARGQQQLLGDSAVTFTPRLVAEVRPLPILRVQANLGTRFREDAGLPSLSVGHELTWGMGAGLFVVQDVLEARVEVWGSAGIANLDEPIAAPAELFAGARVTPVDGLVLGLGGGLGLSTGYGTPAFRGALTVSWIGPSQTREPAPSETTPATGTRPGPVLAALAEDLGPSEEPSEPEPSAEPSPLATTEPTSAGGTDDAATPGGSAAPPEATLVRADERAPTLAGRRARIPREAYAELDRDGDRIPDARDLCPLDPEDFDEIQDDDGCPEEDADGDGLPDTEDRCPLTEGSQRDPSCAGCPERACMARSGGSIDIGDRVEFQRGSDVIDPASENVLRDVLAILRTNEQIRRLRIEGHTDSMGNDDTNLQLSRRRAASVRRWLGERGIAPERVEAWGCGELHPIQTNERSAGRRANRRVEFLIVDPPTDQALHTDCQSAE